LYQKQSLGPTGNRAASDRADINREIIMPKFISGEDKETLRVSLEDDQGDVDILINGVVVAFFSQESGRLMLMCDIERHLKGSGLAFESDRIEVGK
jgi:hypothetical protein